MPYPIEIIASSNEINKIKIMKDDKKNNDERLLILEKQIQEEIIERIKLNNLINQ